MRMRSSLNLDPIDDFSSHADVDMGTFHPYTVLHTLTDSIIHMEPIKRNPDGLATQKPIALRLMPNERADAERISRESNVSMSRLAREAFLKGLPLVSSSAAAPTSPTPSSGAAAFTGGEASASPAGLSLKTA